jgi:hypothetical protein
MDQIFLASSTARAIDIVSSSEPVKREWTCRYQEAKQELCEVFETGMLRKKFKIEFSQVTYPGMNNGKPMDDGQVRILYNSQLRVPTNFDDLFLGRLYEEGDKTVLEGRFYPFKANKKLSLIHLFMLLAAVLIWSTKQVIWRYLLIIMILLAVFSIIAAAKADRNDFAQLQKTIRTL